MGTDSILKSRPVTQTPTPLSIVAVRESESDLFLHLPPWYFTMFEESHIIHLDLTSTAKKLTISPSVIFTHALYMAWKKITGFIIMGCLKTYLSLSH